MTILITALTHTQIVQLSDRRRTRRGGEPIDTDHKAISVCNHMRFATAGSVDIAGDEAVQWFMGTLGSGMSQRDVPERIADAAQRQVRASTLPTAALGFVGAGWASDDDGNLRAWWCSISNVERAFMEFGDPIDDHFYGLNEFLPDDEPVMLHLVRPIRGHLDDVAADARVGVAYLTKYAVLDDPNSIKGHLVNYAQHIASQDDRVGSSLLITSLPRVAAGRPEPLLAINPPDTRFAPRLELDAPSHIFVRRPRDPRVPMTPFQWCPETGGIQRSPVAMARTAGELVAMTDNDPFFKDAIVPDDIRRQVEREREQREETPTG